MIHLIFNLQRDVAMARQPILEAKLVHPSLFVTRAFRNGLLYRNADGRVNSGDDVSTSCRNLVSFGPATPEFILKIHYLMMIFCVFKAYTVVSFNH